MAPEDTNNRKSTKASNINTTKWIDAEKIDFALSIKKLKLSTDG
jgi:hypothetical protein